MYRRQGSRPFPRKRNAKQKGCLRRPYKYLEKKRSEKQRRKGKIYPLKAIEFQRISRRDKKAFLSDQCKEIGENSRMGKTKDLFKKKLEIPRELFMQRWAQ